MGDVTARILVRGRYMLRLWENDRASWDCIDLIPDMERKPRTTLACVSPETILKDGLLMIAIHCHEDKEIIKRAISMLKAKDMKIVSTYQHQPNSFNFFNLANLASKQLAELYAMNRKDSDTATRTAQSTDGHLVITILANGSSIGGELKELKHNGCGVEIAHSKWTDEPTKA